MPSSFTFDLDAEGIGTVVFDLPGESVNKLSVSLFDEIDGLLRKLEQDTNLKAVVLRSGKPDCFIVGADLHDIAAQTDPSATAALSRRAQQMMERFEKLRAPVVAAIHGVCVGGGLELVLACAYRVASDSPKTVLGLPEVKVGLLPGAGGCQRMPRLIGLEAALDLILGGKNVYPKKALRVGLVDEVVPKEVLPRAAHAAARRLAAHGLPLRKPSLRRRLLESTPMGRGMAYKKARALVLQQTHGHYPAPLHALAAIRAGFELGRPRGYEEESRLFGELLGGHAGTISHRLIDLFFAMQEAKKAPAPGGGAARPVQKAGILGGGGFMGSGIAIVAAEAGAVVRLRDRDLPTVGHGLKACRDHFAEQAKRGSLTRYELEQRMNLVSGTTDYTGFRRCDLVIEAVFEDLALKRKVLAEVEEATGPDCVFASNTSSLPIADIAAQARRPENVIGMHFFSPVPKMPLLEVIVTPKTSPVATATTVEFGKQLGKTVIVVKDAPGFYTSRVLGGMLREAAYLLAAGADIALVDRAMMNFGFPVGPITLLDEVGIDVGVKVAKILHDAFGERMGFPDGMSKVHADGRLGRKNQRGFYLYDPKTKAKTKRVDESVYRLFPDWKPMPFFEVEVQDRLALAFANESVLCLEEGILSCPRDGDLGAILGLGFPPFLGGPFRWIDSLGVASALGSLQGFESRFGSRWRPAGLLLEMAKSNKKFYPKD
ncbi:MAG: enoyl-CoA hydratase/isomerase family protein [Planctomycetes bacterium]|nr:enoyl-CoA hydratase/isomerase family protein [Planctomycetota bacterium]